MVELEIDGKTLQVEDGSTVIEAARKVGAYVPHFCYHKKLSIAANCRMCLVQVEKAPKPVASCAFPVADGMRVFTDTPVVRNARLPWAKRVDIVAKSYLTGLRRMRGLEVV